MQNAKCKIDTVGTGVSTVRQNAELSNNRKCHPERSEAKPRDLHSPLGRGDRRRRWVRLEND